jgi:hypothetical protein
VQSLFVMVEEVVALVECLVRYVAFVCRANISSHEYAPYLLFTAFNWKEKMLLRLEKKAQRKKQSGGMKDYGFLEELGNEVNDIPMRPVEFPSKNDYLVPTNKLVGVDPASNGRTELNMSLIFGSSKPYGMLPSKPHKQRFSMKRVFDKETGVATSRVRSKAK